VGFEFTYTFPWKFGLKVDGSLNARAQGRQPLYEEIEASYEAVELAVLRRQVRECGFQLMALADLVDRSERLQANRLFRELDVLAEGLETDKTGWTPDAQNLLDEVLECSNKICQLAMARLENPSSSNPGPTGSPLSHTNSARPDAQLPPAIVKAKDVSVSLAGRAILDKVDVHISPGEVVGVIGRNGSGKSTLLKTLAGTLPLMVGDVRYPILQQQFTRLDAQLNEIVLVGERPIGPSLQVEKALRMYAAVRGLKRSEQDDEVAFTLTRSGLWAYRTYNFSELSAGYKTRFELAKAMISDPQVLLLDEPFSPLDMWSRQWYLRVLKDLAISPRRKTAVIIAVQDVTQILQVADQILVVENGTIRESRQNQSTRSVFEFIVRGPDLDLQEALADLPQAELHLDSVPYRLRVDEQVDRAEIIRRILDEGIDLLYFRDISASPEARNFE
jgi:ABC-2 type transport system ATP-binding protein